VSDIFNCNNFLQFLKNKYGNFVMLKAVSLLSSEEKLEVKDFILKKVNVTGSKDKAQVCLILENL
jgi:hypothetical protein